MSRLQSLIEGEQLLKEAGQEEEEKTSDQVGNQNMSSQPSVKSLDQQAPGLGGEQLAQKMDAITTTSAQGAASEGSGTSVQISVEGVK